MARCLREIWASVPALPGRVVPETSKLIGTLVATLPGAWRYRVIAREWMAQCQNTVTG